MSNKTSISLMLVIFLAGLAGIAWIASSVSGYRFGSAFTGVIAGVHSAPSGIRLLAQSRCNDPGAA